MPTLRKIIFICTAALAMFYPWAASSDMRICNNSCSNIWTAGGEQYLSNSSRDFVSGWFFTTPGQCSTPIIGDVCYWWANVWGNCSDNVLVFGEDADGHQWGGAQAICTTQSAFFDQPPEYNPSHGPCPGGRSSLGWFVYNYGHTSDVTVNLLCPR